MYLCCNNAQVLSVVVDGDPHFVVQLPKLHQNLCFTVDGRANDVLRLIEEPERGSLTDMICHFSKAYKHTRFKIN